MASVYFVQSAPYTDRTTERNVNFVLTTTVATRVELSTAFRDVSRCYARENISARRFARGVHIARSFVELRI